MVEAALTIAFAAHFSLYLSIGLSVANSCRRGHGVEAEGGAAEESFARVCHGSVAAEEILLKTEKMHSRT